MSDDHKTPAPTPPPGDEPPTPATPPTTPPQGEPPAQAPAPDGDEVESVEGEHDDDKRQTFGRDYVEHLRGKSAGYRLRMKEAESKVESLQRSLFAERLARLDLVVDPEAVPYDPALLDDDDALEAHVEALLDAKPYLKKRKAGGDIGQHTNETHGGGFSLLDAMRANT